MKKQAIILALAFCVCFTACGDHLELDTPEKIAEVYYASEELFNKAAETILKCREKDPYVAIFSTETKLEPSIYVGKEINGLYIQGVGALTDTDYQILYDAFAPLMEKCHFRAVCVSDTHVTFYLERSTYGLSAELYYYLDADFGADVMSQIEGRLAYKKIDPHWYSEIWHD